MTVTLGRLKAALERQRRELAMPPAAARRETVAQQLLYQSALEAAAHGREEGGPREGGLDAVARRRLAELNGSFIAMATLFTTASGRDRVASGHGWSAALAVSGDGSFALLGSEGPELLRWDLATDTITVAGTERDRVACVALTPGGALAVTGDHSGNVTLWRFGRAGAEQAPLCAHRHPVESVAVDASGTVAVSVSAGVADTDGQIMVSRLEGGEPALLRPGAGGPISVALSPGGRTAVGGGRKGQVWAWDLDRPEDEARLLGTHDRLADVTGVAVGDGWAVSAAFDCTVRRWDLSGEQAGTVVGRHHSPMHGVTLAGADSHIVAGGVEGAVLAWPAAAAEAAPVVLGSHDRSVSAVSGTRDGLVISTGKDAVLMRRRLNGALARSAARERPPEIWQLAADASAASALSGGRDGVHRWGPFGARPVVERLSEVPSRGVAPVASGGVVTIDTAGALLLLDGDGAARPLRTQRRVLRVVALPSGEAVVTAEDDGDLYLVPVPSGRVRRIGRHDTGDCRALAVAPDGRWVFAPLGATELCRWDTAGGADPVRIASRCDRIRALAVSPDGTYVASGEGSGAVRLWRPDGSTPDGTGVGSHRDRSVVRAVAFSRDGTVLVSAGDDGDVRSWTVQPGARNGRLATKAMPHDVVALEGMFLLGSRNGGVTAIEATHRRRRT